MWWWGRHGRQAANLVHQLRREDRDRDRPEEPLKQRAPALRAARAEGKLLGDVAQPLRRQLLARGGVVGEGAQDVLAAQRLLDLQVTV